MIFTREDVINTDKVLNCGGDYSNIVSTSELDEIDNFVKNIMKYSRHEEYNVTQFRDEYLSACKVLFDKPKHLYITFIRELTQKKILITYLEVPEFKEHVSDFSKLVRKSRNITDEDYPYLPEIIDTNDELKMNNSIIDVITYSKELGLKDTWKKRTQAYVSQKLTEEVGEHSVEIQVQEGTSYKNAGKDGIMGEAVDIAICAIDSFSLEFPELSAEEIYAKFNEYMLIKLNKWKSQK